MLFVTIYYFQMASAIWWVMLTLTWFLAAALKWGEEAVERLWLLYHIIAWSLPAIQVILILALRLVDGDQLTGVCYTGNYSIVALGVFVFMPLLIYLVLGVIFMIVGFTSLINIRQQLQRDPIKSRKLGRLIVRIGVYSALYTVPNVLQLLLFIYVMAEQEDWEDAYVEDSGCKEDESGSCSSSPSFAAFILRYLALFAIGVFSSSWVMSHKTISAWKKFFASCGCQRKAYEYPMHTKPPPLHPHQTSV